MTDAVDFTLDGKAVSAVGIWVFCDSMAVLDQNNGDKAYGVPPPACREGQSVLSASPLAGRLPARFRDVEMDRWRSGRSRTLGKRVYVKAYRGFESLSVRHRLLL